MRKLAVLAAVCLLSCYHSKAQGLVDSLVACHDYTAAITVIDSLLQGCDSVGVRTLSLQKARMLKKIYRAEEAVDVLTGLVLPGRVDREVMGELADCHFQCGNFNDASSLYSVLLSLQPDNLYFKIRYMMCCYRMEAYPEVVKTGRDVVSSYPVASVAMLVGDSFSNMGQADSAMVYYRKILDRYPKNSGAVNKLSKILLDSKRYDDVLAVTGSYLAQVPDDMVINPIKGLAYYLKGDYRNSLETFRRQKAMGDDSYATSLYIGLNCHMLDMLEEAEKELTNAYSIDSSDVNLLISLASVKKSFYGKFRKESVPLLEKAMEMVQPDSLTMFKIYQEYGIGYYREEEWDKAIEYYRKTYEYNPAFISALSTIGYCYEMKKDWKSALEYYEKYMKVGKPGTKAYEFVESGIAYVKGELFMLE